MMTGDGLVKPQEKPENSEPSPSEKAVAADSATGASGASLKESDSSQPTAAPPSKV